MSNYDLNEQPTGRPKGFRINPWDIMSIVVLLITVCIAGYYVLVFVNPSVLLNPFPPPTPLPQLATATITPIQLPATWTATQPPLLTPTDTPPPTFTLIPSETPFSLVPPTKTLTITATPKAPFSATVQYIASTIIHPDQDCKWLGVGGTVVDSSDAPMIYISIRLVGTLSGTPVNSVTVSGTNLNYGQSGWELPLGNTPSNSSKTLYVQLLDQSGLPLSDNIYINTYSDCSKNLVLVRFKKR
jgi:hypothetical protein